MHLIKTSDFFAILFVGTFGVFNFVVYYEYLNDVHLELDKVVAFHVNLNNLARFLRQNICLGNTSRLLLYC